MKKSRAQHKNYSIFRFFVLKITLVIFNQFHIVRLETQSEKYMALNVEILHPFQFGNLFKKVFF